MVRPEAKHLDVALTRSSWRFLSSCLCRIRQRCSSDGPPVPSDSLVFSLSFSPSAPSSKRRSGRAAPARPRAAPVQSKIWWSRESWSCMRRPSLRSLRSGPPLRRARCSGSRTALFRRWPPSAAPRWPGGWWRPAAAVEEARCCWFSLAGFAQELRGSSWCLSAARWASQGRGSACFGASAAVWAVTTLYCAGFHTLRKSTANLFT